MNTYRAFFGLQQDPFANDLSLKQIMKTPELSAVENRFNYALSLGGVAAITGDIGSGKSTAVRYAQAQLHPSEYQLSCHRHFRCYPGTLPTDRISS
jgi:general secretion pathway protein A